MRHFVLSSGQMAQNYTDSIANVLGKNGILGYQLGE